MVHHGNLLLSLKDLWLNIPLQSFFVKVLCSNSVSFFCLLGKLDRLSWLFLVFLFLFLKKLRDCTSLSSRNYSPCSFVFSSSQVCIPFVSVTFNSSSGCTEIKYIQNRNFGCWTRVGLLLNCPCAAPPVTCWCCHGCLDFSARIGSYFSQVDRLMRKTW